MGLKDKLVGFLRRYFFNPKWRCLACGKEIFDDRDFCEQCERTLPYNDGAICGHCGRKVIAYEEYCSTCKNVLVSLDKCRSAFVYAQPISTLIKKAKYNNGRYLIDYFSSVLENIYLKNYFNADYLVFVPMTEKAKKKRGYNQSELLARNLSKRINVPVLDCIKKIKDTERQATLNRKERIKNLDGAFRVHDKKTIKDKSVVIVDDVSTTGSTAQVIAERLKNAGAKIVNLITVASASPIDQY